MSQVVYCIKCKDPEITDCYVGSTSKFQDRKSRHKLVCNNPNHNSYNRKVYKFIREHGGFDNWEFVVLQEYSEITSKDLVVEEDKYIVQLKPSLNCCRAYCSHDRLKELHRNGKKREYSRNKDKILKRNKEYYDNNRETIIKQKKEYAKKNSEKIKAWRREPIVCECGMDTKRGSISKHRQTKIHKDRMAQLG